MQPPTIADFISASAEILRPIHPDECRLLADLLVSRALNYSRLELPLHRNKLLPEQIHLELLEDIDRLVAGLPWQYLVGETEFLGRIFKCDQRALIPRPETECLTDWFLRESAAILPDRPTIAEVGVGTGCIIISIALAKPDATCIGIDISGDVLDLARENAARHSVAGSIQFVQADLLAGLEAGSGDAIISNPPYVSTIEWRELPIHIRDHEPKQALEAGTDGLTVIRRLIPQAATALKLGGFLYLECAPAQLLKVQSMLEQAGFDEIVTGGDLTGRAHFIRGRTRSGQEGRYEPRSGEIRTGTGASRLQGKQTRMEADRLTELVIPSEVEESRMT